MFDEEQRDAHDECRHEIQRLEAEVSRLRSLEDPVPYMAHLDTVQLRRIVERHVRWRSEAMRLLEQVSKGYEGEWPELAKFISDSTLRPILAHPTTAEGK